MVDGKRNAMTKLEKLLLRKKMAESQMEILSKGAEAYTAYCSELKSSIKERDKTLANLRLQDEFSKAELVAKNFITSLKETKREYNDYLIPEFEKLSDEEKEGIEFLDAKKFVENIVDDELYKSTKHDPENVEHIRILGDYKKNIELTKKLLDELSKAVPTSKLEAARNAKEIFDLNLSLMNLNKRYAERIDYYENQFMPRYRKDMAECEVLLDKYLQRAYEYVKLGVDPTLVFLLQEYEKHKEQSEKLWLFYTALRARCESIAKHMRANKGQFKGFMNLAEKIEINTLKIQNHD